ncbi:MAG: glycosyltransferase [Bacteroidota bacterium]
MNHPLPEKNNGKARILVAPLDWGLGHATRCIPLIRELLAQGAEVWLAGERTQEQLLKTEFPQLSFLSLPGYRIRYAKTTRGLIWKMIRQGPKMRRAIQYEQHWLKKMLKQYQFSAVISDNRYGLHHADVPCIFITHQLYIQSSAGKWTERVLQKRNYRYISKFTECWVPDIEGEDNLAGELAHPLLKPAVPVRYIGLLTRFSKKEIAEKNNHLLIILSGPEPQRSIFENKIIEQITNYIGTATVVRGLPGHSTLVPSTNTIKFYNHLPAAALNNEMMEAAFIISRSGYSTVMDAMALQKKCIFIPTPGQTEQEYLGDSLMKKGMAVCVAQADFSLDRALALAKGFNYQLPPVAGNHLLKKTVSAFLAQLPAPALG